MAVELESSREPGTISVGEMKDGQLGVIVDMYPGAVVQMVRGSRHGEFERLVRVGAISGASWSGPTPTFRVRLLNPGEKIVVTSN